MYLKVQLAWNVIIPPDCLDEKGIKLQREIMIKLLDEIARRRTSKDYGYYIALTKIDNIGEGMIRVHTGEVMFRVEFGAITFTAFRGEVMKGVVQKVWEHGVVLRCGPIENVFLSCKKMPGYSYVDGENPEFVNEKMPKIGRDVVVRFAVMETMWLEEEMELQVLATLEGEFLGPQC